jgi:hypothetical protein
MIPQTAPRKKKNSSKVNLTISFTVHALIVVILIYFAAREGFLGKKLQKISVTMVKEKPPEKPPEPVKPKIEPPKEIAKAEPPKVLEAPKEVTAPPSTAPPTVAPPSTDVPALDFGGGAQVDSESDPVKIYKSRMEYELREKWNRPEDLDDEKYVAEVQVDVDRSGNISNPNWQKGSGNVKWDDSVRAVFDVVKSMSNPPPTNFPPRVTIRFDVQTEEIANPLTR